MIEEKLETRSTEKPDWFEMTEPEKVKHTYWTCGGTDVPRRLSVWERFRKTSDYQPGWRNLYHSKEEAEADAASLSKMWEWDGLPARPRLLSDTMFHARRKGDLGVQVKAYKDGRWQIVKQWSASEPLQGEDL